MPGTKTPQSASAAEDAYLELDDDELLELACANLDSQQDGTAAGLEQPSQAFIKPPVLDTQAPTNHDCKTTGGNSQTTDLCKQPLTLLDLPLLSQLQSRFPCALAAICSRAFRLETKCPDIFVDVSSK